jgi:AcrR family transcriptional regulator
MARPKSEDKRNAILSAAIVVFAERGIWQTPTSAISKAAGVAEGTLFTYFSTKDGLLNELYRVLKREIADALLADFPKTDDLRGQFYHLWVRYIRWGVANPQKRKVMVQLHDADAITAESRAVGEAPLAELLHLAKQSIQNGQFRAFPVTFAAALFNGMAETTIAYINQTHVEDIDLYCLVGFDIFWSGIAAH